MFVLLCCPVYFDVAFQCPDLKPMTRQTLFWNMRLPRHRLGVSFNGEPPERPDREDIHLSYLQRHRWRTYRALHDAFANPAVSSSGRVFGLIFLLHEPADASEFLPDAIGMLKSDDQGVRLYALKFLEKYGGPKHLSAVFPVLDMPESIDRALVTIGRLGDSSTAADLVNWRKRTNFQFNQAMQSIYDDALKNCRQRVCPPTKLAPNP